MVLLTVLTLALVGGRAVTNRDVYVDLLTQPEEISKIQKKVMTKSKIDFEKLKTIEKDFLDNALNRLMTQVMIVEESKVVGTIKVRTDSIDKRLEVVKSLWGVDNWNLINRYFDLAEDEVRARVEKNILVEQIIENRIRLSGVGEDSSIKKAELAQAAIEEWLTQLKSRYPVQYFKTSSLSQPKAEGR
jgi:hypothetical protein